MDEIRQVAVIGAGTMGAGIASHVANAGIPVVLLDVARDAEENRNAIAQGAIKRLLESSPPAFMDRKNAHLITPGNVDDHLEWLSRADWIAEAVVERLDVKQRLYREIDRVRKPGSCVSSNTSTIPLAQLTRGMSDEFSADFCITHFFNPVRYMRLLELVDGPSTRAGVTARLAEFCDVALGKGVVRCKDTPGFLANRIGVYALQMGVMAAAELGLSIEEADAIMGRPMGIPKTGVFGLYDLIGLDLMIDVVGSLANALPADDPFQAVAPGIPLITELVAQGQTGNKGPGGFYRTRRHDGEPTREAVDLADGRYRPARRPKLDAAIVAEDHGLRALVETADVYGEYAWRVVSRTLAYAASLIPEISDDFPPVDEAMKLGYGWLRGPFEMIDDLGAGWFRNKLEAETLEIPAILSQAGDEPLYRVRDGQIEHFTLRGGYAKLLRAPGVIRLGDLARTTRPIVTNAAATLWDVGDQVACVEFHTKANALGPASMDLLRESIPIVQRDFKALLIHNDAPHFSVGFNLDFALNAIRDSDWAGLDQALTDFQQACLAIKYAPFPVVAAPAGMALGGGYEVLAHCDALQVHANTVVGLVESLVGLIPSGGGCKEMLHRWTAGSTSAEDRVSGAVKVFEIIATAKTAASPIEAAPLRFVRPQDRTTMNRDRLLADAKALALGLARDYTPPEPPTFRGLGNAGRDAMSGMLTRFEDRGLTTAHDLVVGGHLAQVLCGGDEVGEREVSELDLCGLERTHFIALAKTPATSDRIAHMLEHGRRLRN